MASQSPSAVESSLWIPTNTSSPRPIEPTICPSTSVQTRTWPCAVALLVPVFMTVVRIEHSIETVRMRSSGFEVLIAIFFTFAVAAYWIFERDRTIGLLQSLVPRQHRRVLRDTWLLIDQKLGAFVRGELVLIVFVAVILSAGFYGIGLHFWLLIGSFAGIVEIVPILGPLVAGALAVGVGLTQSWQEALFAGLIVLAVRQVEDFLVAPRVLGHAVGLSPLVVLVSVTAIGILFGGFYVLLAIPIAAVLATLLDVVVRDADPAEEDVPPLLFPAKDAEA